MLLDAEVMHLIVQSIQQTEHRREAVFSTRPGTPLQQEEKETYEREDKINGSHGWDFQGKGEL